MSSEAPPPSTGLVDTEPPRQVFGETLGRADAAGRMRGRRVLVVGGGQEPYTGPPPARVGNGRAIVELLAREREIGDV